MKTRVPQIDFFVTVSGSSKVDPGNFPGLTNSTELNLLLISVFRQVQNLLEGITFQSSGLFIVF